jgi:hypothetical protein
MSVVVDLSAREMFTPCELIAAYKEFTERGAQCLSVETGLSASAYCFGERVLLVYEEPKTGLVVLTHPSAWKGNSPKCAPINGHLADASTLCSAYSNPRGRG